MSENTNSTVDAPKKRGGGTKNEQIARLRETVGPNGVSDAQNLVANYSADVLRLAVKMDDRKPNPNEIVLGARVEAILLECEDETERASLRANMIALKKKAAKTAAAARAASD